MVVNFLNKTDAGNTKSLLHRSTSKIPSVSAISTGIRLGRRARLILLAAALVSLLLGGIGFYADYEPKVFDVQQNAAEITNAPAEQQLAPGIVTTATLVRVTETLLTKRCGYLSNDIMPPFVLMDNIPNWEFGVVVQMRDFVRALRNDFSRSQSQSREDDDLALADPRLSFDNESWIFPSTESQYRDGEEYVRRYLKRLQGPGQRATFFIRADNLREYLTLASKRLGDLAQRLGASVGSEVFDAHVRDLPQNLQGTALKPEDIEARPIKTPWLQLDDVFYEARGGSWAMLHFLRALSIDFKPVLQDKNAQTSLENVLQALEKTQDTVWSPVILNGRGFAVFANHSLILASYISRANAALIDLRNLLFQG